MQAPVILQKWEQEADLLIGSSPPSIVPHSSFSSLVTLPLIFKGWDSSAYELQVLISHLGRFILLSSGSPYLKLNSRTKANSEYSIPSQINTMLCLQMMLMTVIVSDSKTKQSVYCITSHLLCGLHIQSLLLIIIPLGDCKCITSSESIRGILEFSQGSLLFHTGSPFSASLLCGPPPLFKSFWYEHIHFQIRQVTE